MITDYDWYDPDKDVFKTGGRGGMALAAAIFERAGGFDAYFSRKPICEEALVKTKRKSKKRPKPVDYEKGLVQLEIIAKIALMPFSHLGTGERVGAREYRKRLSKLMHAGYPVEVGFSEGGRSKLMAEYENIKREIEDLLEQHPRIKKRIEARNLRLQSPYDFR